MDLEIKKNAPELIHRRKLTGQQRHLFPLLFGENTDETDS
jgi:hypothetical protein